jgi:hypothetical protein
MKKKYPLKEGLAYVSKRTGQLRYASQQPEVEYNYSKTENKALSIKRWKSNTYENEKWLQPLSEYHALFPVSRGMAVSIAVREDYDEYQDKRIKSGNKNVFEGFQDAAGNIIKPYFPDSNDPSNNQDNDEANPLKNGITYIVPTNPHRHKKSIGIALEPAVRIPGAYYYESNDYSSPKELSMGDSIHVQSYGTFHYGNTKAGKGNILDDIFIDTEPGDICQSFNVQLEYMPQEFIYDSIKTINFFDVIGTRLFVDGRDDKRGILTTNEKYAYYAAGNIIQIGHITDLNIKDNKIAELVVEINIEGDDRGHLDATVFELTLAEDADFSKSYPTAIAIGKSEGESYEINLVRKNNINNMPPISPGYILWYYSNKEAYIFTDKNYNTLNDFLEALNDQEKESLSFILKDMESIKAVISISPNSYPAEKESNINYELFFTQGLISLFNRKINNIATTQSYSADKKTFSIKPFGGVKFGPVQIRLSYSFQTIMSVDILKMGNIPDSGRAVLGNLLYSNKRNITGIFCSNPRYYFAGEKILAMRTGLLRINTDQEFIPGKIYYLYFLSENNKNVKEFDTNFVNSSALIPTFTCLSCNKIADNDYSISLLVNCTGIEQKTYNGSTQVGYMKPAYKAMNNNENGNKDKDIIYFSEPGFIILDGKKALSTSSTKITNKSFDEFTKVLGLTKNENRYVEFIWDNNKKTIEGNIISSLDFGENKIIPKGTLFWDNTDFDETYSIGEGKSKVYKLEKDYNTSSQNIEDISVSLFVFDDNENNVFSPLQRIFYELKLEDFSFYEDGFFTNNPETDLTRKRLVILPRWTWGANNNLAQIKYCIDSVYEEPLIPYKKVEGSFMESNNCISIPPIEITPLIWIGPNSQQSLEYSFENLGNARDTLDIHLYVNISIGENQSSWIEVSEGLHTFIDNDEQKTYGYNWIVERKSDTNNDFLLKLKVSDDPPGLKIKDFSGEMLDLSGLSYKIIIAKKNYIPRMYDFDAVSLQDSMEKYIHSEYKIIPNGPPFNEEEEYDMRGYYKEKVIAGSAVRDHLLGIFPLGNQSIAGPLINNMILANSIIGDMNYDKKGDDIKSKRYALSYDNESSYEANIGGLFPQVSFFKNLENIQNVKEDLASFSLSFILKSYYPFKPGTVQDNFETLGGLKKVRFVMRKGKSFDIIGGFRLYSYSDVQDSLNGTPKDFSLFTQNDIDNLTGPDEWDRTYFENNSFNNVPISPPGVYFKERSELGGGDNFTGYFFPNLNNNDDNSNNGINNNTNNDSIKRWAIGIDNNPAPVDGIHLQNLFIDGTVGRFFYTPYTFHDIKLDVCDYFYPNVSINKETGELDGDSENTLFWPIAPGSTPEIKNTNAKIIFKNSNRVLNKKYLNMLISGDILNQHTQGTVESGVHGIPFDLLDKGLKAEHAKDIFGIKLANAVIGTFHQKDDIKDEYIYKDSSYNPFEILKEENEEENKDYFYNDILSIKTTMPKNTSNSSSLSTFKTDIHTSYIPFITVEKRESWNDPYKYELNLYDPDNIRPFGYRNKNDFNFNLSKTTLNNLTSYGKTTLKNLNEEEESLEVNGKSVFKDRAVFNMINAQNIEHDALISDNDELAFTDKEVPTQENEDWEGSSSFWNNPKASYNDTTSDDSDDSDNNEGSHDINNLFIYIDTIKSNLDRLTKAYNGIMIDQGLGFLLYNNPYKEDSEEDEIKDNTTFRQRNIIRKKIFEIIQKQVDETMLIDNDWTPRNINKTRKWDDGRTDGVILQREITRKYAVLNNNDYDLINNFVDTGRNQAKATNIWKNLTGSTLDEPPIGFALIKENFTGQTELVYENINENKWVFKDAFSSSAINYTLSFVIKIPKSTDRGVVILGHKIEEIDNNKPLSWDLNGLTTDDLFFNIKENYSYLSGLNVKIETDSSVYKTIKIYWDINQTYSGEPVAFLPTHIKNDKPFSKETDDYILPIEW